MVKTNARGFCRLDQLVWAHSVMRSLTDSAALAYIYLICWSKALNRDGFIDAFAISTVGGTLDDVDELCKAGFMEIVEGGWIIPKWGDWQNTNSDIEKLRDTSRINGARGGRPTVSRSEENVSLDTEKEKWLGVAFGAWPPPSKGFSVESAKNVREAFYASVDTKEDWDKFQVALDQKLERYRTSPESRDDKRKFLSSFQKFCASWRDFIAPTEERIQVQLQTPQAQLAPVPYQIVIEEEIR